jgi:hypothetical protein
MTRNTHIRIGSREETKKEKEQTTITTKNPNTANNIEKE